jgi:uncharacterized BrkB/YihY/UPF0761 family membrane protein
MAEVEHTMSETTDPSGQHDEAKGPEGRPSLRSRVDRRLRHTAIGRFGLRIANELAVMEVFDRSMTLAAQAFTSILPLLIVVAAISRGGSRPLGSTLSSYLGLDSSATHVLEGVVPASSDIFSALGWFGTLLVLVSATAFSRALDRFYARVWAIRKVGLRGAWRWLVVLTTILLAVALLQFTRSIVAFDGGYVVLAAIVEFVLWTFTWLLTGWVVLNRDVSLRSLFPGAVLCGFGLAIAGGAGRIYLPITLTSAAHQFGALGITIAYIGWLFIIMFIVVVSVTIGKVLATDYGAAGTVKPRVLRPE